MGPIKDISNDRILEKFVRDQILTPGLKINTDPGNIQSPRLLLNAATKRGWEVKRISRTVYHFFDEAGLVGGIQGGVTSLVSSLGVTICNRKHLSRSAFLAAGVPTPISNSFPKDKFEEALQYFQETSKPVVVKPSNGMMGNGITTNVLIDEVFEEAWEKASRNLQGEILVEEQVRGLDVRAFTIGTEVVAAVSRIPAFVIGDGRSTLADLLEQLREQRRVNGYLNSLKVVVDEKKLIEYGLNYGSILEPDSIYFLNRTSNTHQGAINVDITSSLSNSLKEMAVNAKNAIPGLGVVGIDLLVEDLTDASSAHVLEANVGASLLLHHYPGIGYPVNTADLVLDEMERAQRRSALPH